MVLRNKKAQDFNLGMIAAIIVIVVGVIIYVLFYTSIGAKLRGATDKLPGDLSSASISCAQWAGSSTLSTAFCDFKELSLSDGKQWANCVGVYDASAKYVAADKIGFTKDAKTCSDTAAVTKCMELSQIKGVDSSVKVNLKTCKDILATANIKCEGLGAELKSACSDTQLEVSKWVVLSDATQKCCYPSSKKCSGTSTVQCALVAKADCVNAGCTLNGETCSGALVDCSKVNPTKCTDFFGCTFS